METKKYTQFGTFSVMLMLPLLIFFVVMILLSGFDNAIEILILSFLLITFLICLLIFYKLTIYVDNSHISFKLGTGLIHKEYPIADIESCKPVKNSFLYGIGIRLTPDGWLYNVSGLYAIELTFKNKKSKIRIGTNKPEEISQTINKILEKQNNGFALEPTHRSTFFIFWTVLLVVLILPIITIVTGNQETKLDLTDSNLKIKGIYGLTINYSEIIQIDTLNNIPKIKTRTNGYAFGKTLKGNFKLQDQTKVKLYVKKGISPYIHIKTKDIDHYLNFTNSNRTVDVYNKIANNLRINK